MSQLLDTQIQFVKDVQWLIQYAYGLGYSVTYGEVLRTIEQQKIYFDTGKSKTMKSAHLEKRAVDLNFFKKDSDGKYVQVTSVIELKPIGDWWQALSPKHDWGGDGWRNSVGVDIPSSFVDGPHFEIKI
jgi:hypothetical protein